MVMGFMVVVNGLVVVDETRDERDQRQKGQRAQWHMAPKNKLRSDFRIF